MGVGLLVRALDTQRIMPPGARTGGNDSQSGLCQRGAAAPDSVRSAAPGKWSLTMCGIYGAINHRHCDDQVDLLVRLALAMESRGRASYGLAYASRSQWRRRRGVGTVPVAVLAESAWQGSAVAGHCRYPTQGEVALETSHPFRHAGWLVAHNGGCNDTPAWRCTVDSQYLARQWASGKKLPREWWGTFWAVEVSVPSAIWLVRSGCCSDLVVWSWRCPHDREGVAFASIAVPGITPVQRFVIPDRAVSRLTELGPTLVRRLPRSRTERWLLPDDVPTPQWTPVKKAPLRRRRKLLAGLV